MKLLSFLLILMSSISFAKNSDYMLYRPETQNIHPIQYYMNGAFDVIQNPYWFNQEDYWEKHKIVWDRIKTPFKSIKEDGGWEKFIKEEFLGSRAFPNIALHMVGGGYDHRMLQEYFEHQGMKYAFWNATMVTYLTKFGNEALEVTNEEEITSHDHIADLFFFDLVGILLFQNDDVVRFFRDKMQMTHWHFQPMLDVNSFRVTNAALNYVFRPKLKNYKTRPFLLVGMQTLFGASYEFEPGKYLTVAPGLSLTDPLKMKGRFVFSVSYDTDNDLNWNLLLNGSEDYRVRLNVFPNFMRSRVGDIGLLAGTQKGDNYVIGLKWKMPIGYALRWQ